MVEYPTKYRCELAFYSEMKMQLKIGGILSQNQIKLIR